MAAAFVALGAASPEAAQALWSAGSGGSGVVLAVVVPQGNTPVAVADGRDVTVSWEGSAFPSGDPVAGYRVRRYASNGGGQSGGGTCAGVITSTSCVDTNVSPGTWRYTVTPVQSGWSGAESGQSSAITVGSATLTFTSSTTITTLPATLTGTIAGFLSLEPLSYRLDSATGTVLSGTPSTAGIGGTANITVTIPAGTSDAPHSVFVVGGLGSVASAAIQILDPPNLSTLRMYDTNTNGKIDTVVATFDEALGSYDADAAPWTLTNVPSAGTLSSVSVAGSAATLNLTEGAGAATTAAGGFTVALAANSTGVKDVYNHPASFGATAVADFAAPALTAAPVMRDGNGNGKIDTVTATFSEALATYSAGTAPWTLANVPSTGTLASVAVSSPNVTLTITEGAGAINTAVDSFTIAMAANASGVRDAAGNLTTLTAGAPSDGASPVRSSLSFFDDDRDGRVDRVAAVFSETLAPYGAATSPWTLTAAPSAATLQSVSVTGATADVFLNEGAGTVTTAVGTFTVALAANAAGVRDAAGNVSSFTAATPTDKAAPAYQWLYVSDIDGNGQIDRVNAIFTETLATYTAGNTPWTLTGVPSGGTLASVSVATTTATLTLTEGAGAKDTAVGSMLVALSSSATGVRDAAGNLTALSALAPLDNAGALPATVIDTNAGIEGRLGAGDTISFTFTEALDAASVPANTTVTLADPSGSGSDTLTVAGITNGARSTGSDSYVTTDKATASFASTVTLSADRKTITVTVGSVCSGTGCSVLGTAPAAASFSMSAATTLKDAAGLAAATTALPVSIRLF